jgi:hypothetical protein
MPEAYVGGADRDIGAAIIDAGDDASAGVEVGDADVRAEGQAEQLNAPVRRSDGARERRRWFGWSGKPAAGALQSALL